MRSRWLRLRRSWLAFTWCWCCAHPPARSRWTGTYPRSPHIHTAEDPPAMLSTLCPPAFGSNTLNTTYCHLSMCSLPILFRSQCPVFRCEISAQYSPKAPPACRIACAIKIKISSAFLCIVWSSSIPPQPRLQLARVRVLPLHSPAVRHDIMVHVLAIARVPIVNRPAGKRAVYVLTRCLAMG